MTEHAVLAPISRQELWEKLESGAELVLVDALSPMSFAAAHLPGAINLTTGEKPAFR